MVEVEGTNTLFTAPGFRHLVSRYKKVWSVREDAANIMVYRCANLSVSLANNKHYFHHQCCRLIHTMKF